MAAKLLRNAMTWLAAPFQPSILPLTMVLVVLFVVATVDLIAFMMLNKFQ